MLNDMATYTGKTFTIKQVKNKWENLKKEWKLYDRLMRLETGIGGTRSLIDASPEWWAEKINENKDFAKFKDTDLSIYESHYAPLFRDSVAVGDHSMTPLQFQNNNTNDDQGEEHAEGSGDSDDMHSGDGTPLYRGFPATSTSKRKQKGTAKSRSTRTKTSSYEDKLDTVLEALSSRSTNTYPPKQSCPTTQDCLNIVTSFPDSKEGRSQVYRKVIRIFMNKQARECFMCPTSNEEKMVFLQDLIDN
ncbi:hypothetical protein LXL04_038347 [Taraxacum kok-saghyz]